MNVYIDNKLIETPKLTMPVRQYGQGRGAKRWYRYRVELGLAEFIELTQPIYDQLVEDEKKDFFNQPGEFPDMDRLKELDYPIFAQLLQAEPDFVKLLVREWMEVEILNKMTRNATAPIYWINSLDKVTIETANQYIVLEGAAYN